VLVHGADYVIDPRSEIRMGQRSYAAAVDADSLRRAYAEQVVLGAPRTIIDALIEAYARVPREVFLGPGPWSIVRTDSSSEMSPDASLEHIYRDVLVAIDASKHLNNGQPSAHAKWMLAAAPRPGESVLHIGCGTGYYTAIFAELVGSAGRVVAYDVEAELVGRARVNLAAWPQAEANVGDASELHGDFDVIYVNAGATHARREWLAALRPAGRLVIPLTIHTPQFPTHGVGVVVAIEHTGERWPLRVVTPVGIYDCVGARDPEAEGQLAKLLARARAGERAAMTGLVVMRAAHERTPACLLHVDGFCVYSPPPPPPPPESPPL
jgi:protein-L-isoaspartate(D-aspartate) O-methyltransferase